MPSPAARFLAAGGILSGRATDGREMSLSPTGSANRDGTPYQASVFVARGLNGRYTGGSTAFALAVDSGTGVGNAVQIRLSYDLTGNGSWDRVETFRYFATDPVPGAENYTQQTGLASVTGSWGDLDGGTVQVEIWSALSGPGASPTVASSSSVSLPFG